jgi:hypothetical protein
VLGSDVGRNFTCGGWSIGIVTQPIGLDFIGVIVQYGDLSIIPIGSGGEEGIRGD